MLKVREWETSGSLLWNGFNGNVKEICSLTLKYHEVKMKEFTGIEHIYYDDSAKHTRLEKWDMNLANIVQLLNILGYT